MTELKAPSFMTIAGEALTPFEFARLIAASPSLVREARSNGEPVIVLPGLGASNASTTLLRGYLSWLGYDVQGWTLGRNRGNVAEMLPQVADQVRSLHTRTRSKVNLVVRLNLRCERVPLETEAFDEGSAALRPVDVRVSSEVCIVIANRTVHFSEYGNVLQLLKLALQSRENVRHFFAHGGRGCQLTMCTRQHCRVFGLLSQGLQAARKIV